MTQIIHVYEVKAVLQCLHCSGILVHTVRVGGTPMDPHVPEPVTLDPDPDDYITPTDPEEAFMHGLQRSIGKSLQIMFPGAEVRGGRLGRTPRKDESGEWNFEITREEWEALGRPRLFDRLTRTVEVVSEHPEEEPFFDDAAEEKS